MIHDYDLYMKKKTIGTYKLQKDIGHDLTKALKEVAKCYHIKKISDKVQVELTILNDRYKAHSLRYGMVINIFQDSSGFNFDLINRKLLQAMKIIDHNNVFVLK